MGADQLYKLRGADHSAVLPMTLVQNSGQYSNDKGVGFQCRTGVNFPVARHRLCDLLL